MIQLTSEMGYTLHENWYALSTEQRKEILERVKSYVDSHLRPLELEYDWTKGAIADWEIRIKAMEAALEGPRR